MKLTDSSISQLIMEAIQNPPDIKPISAPQIEPTPQIVPTTQIEPTPNPATFVTTSNQKEKKRPTTTELLEQGRIGEAMIFLEKDLAEALNNGDAAKAELVTADQLGVAVALKDLTLLKNVRTMRLELFAKTNQKLKTREEYVKLKNMCEATELAEFIELIDFDIESIVKADRAEKPLLDRMETYFIVDNVELNNTGIKSSVLRKINLLEEEWDYSTTLVISGYNPDLKGILGYHQYLNASRINTSTKVLNVYNYIQNTDAPDLPVIRHPRNKEGFSYQETRPNVFMVYESEKLVRQEAFTHLENRLQTVTHFNEEKKITQVDFYDTNGYLSKTRIFDGKPNQFSKETYYTTDGNVCILSEYKFKNDKNELVRITLYDSKGDIILEGDKESDLVGFFIDQVAASSDNICLFVAESGLYSKAMIHVKQENAIKAAVVHSVFLEDPYNLKSKPQFFFKDLVYYQSHFDGIVFLTKTESNDFSRLYGKPQRIFTVPNFYPKEILEADFNARNHRKAVIVARFDLIKRLDVAVDIFKLVVEELPDVILDIYGFGSDAEKRRIQEHIKKTGMENHVFIKGSTDRPEEVYSTGSLFMMTSLMEGMPLTMIESICNGCPAFSFDIKYGPSDIIKNGKTGFLIPRGNNKAFAKQMISYFEDIDLQRQMSENAYKDAHRFSKEVYLENWYSFMEGVCAQHEKSIADHT